MNDRLTAEQVLKEKGFFVKTTAGISMKPLFRDRCDRVVIKPVTQRLKKYDVPLYRRGDELVLHRVIEVKSDGYIICGDNCVNFEDVKDEQIIGVLSEFYRKNRHYTVESKGYRLYSKIWVAIYPVRMFFKRVRGSAAKIYHKLWRKNG